MTPTGRTRKLKLTLAFTTLLSVLFAADPAGARELPLAFINQHCADCHTGDDAEGGFRADGLAKDLGNTANHKAWSRVLARVQSGEMPPPQDAERPSEAEIVAALGALKTAFHEAANARHGEVGRVRVRRLNRLEYENTIHDLLGIDTPLQDLLPEDDLRDGFANNTEALSISPVHIRQYMAAADLALQEATARQARPETQTHRFSYTHDAEKPFHGHAHNKLQCNLRGEDLHFFLDTHIEVPAYLRQFGALTRTTPGRYRVRVTAEARDTTDNDDLVFSVWLAAGGKRRKLLGYFDAPFGKPTTIELTHHFERSETIIVAPYRMEQIRTDASYSIYLPDKKENIPEGWHHIRNPNPPIPTVGPALVIKPVEITGPLLDEWPPRGHRLLYGNAELAPAAEVAKTARVPESITRPVRGYQVLANPLTVQTQPGDAAKTQLADFMTRAFRRPVASEDVDRYFALVSERLERGECYEVAMNAAHRAVLCSPGFLFLVEEPGMLTKHALASRLSYFLWRTMPDERLLTADLEDPAVLRKETERLLASPRSDAFVNDFLDHWLNLREINATTPDRDLFPEYFVNCGSGVQDILLHESIVQESRLFFRDLIERDLGASLLVKSPHTFLNQRLAQHYDLPPIKGTQLRRVDLPADSVRGGVLTQASVLKVTANGANTSPVLRGAWLLERIVGTPAPPPPPNAGGIEPDTRGATTIREQLAKHKSSQSCAGCHQKIDPPGFVLEAFDPIGRQRDYYRTTETGEKLNDARVWLGSHYGHVKYLKGNDVDTTCVLPDETTVSDVRAYKDVLSHRPELIARNLTAKLVTFATGVHVEPGDALAIDGILARSKASEYGLKTLIHEAVQSELFTRK
ncbi:MAG: DUF1592 domain-containing protein [Planctomycetota bacterium]|jgi:mono/diheme cytochrome c family protein